MESKKKYILPSKPVWPVELLIGILILIVVFISSTRADISRAEDKLLDDVNYIKEQCNSYNRLNLASETKSLMRVMESAQQIKRNMEYETRLSGEQETEIADLKNYAQNNYVTGVILLNADGSLQKEYYTDDVGAEGLKEELSNTSLLDTAGFPEKSYSTRSEWKDGSYIDIGACGRTDGSGIIVTYYHTPEEYVTNFNLSFSMLMKGYSIEQDGTISITSGDEIIASNNKKVVGKNVDDIAILKTIKENAGSGKLLHAKKDSKGMGCNFGLIERGRDYYVYAYLPEKAVFTTTLRNIHYAMILYIMTLIVLNMVRWRTAQDYQKEQLRIQEVYAANLKSKNIQLEESIKREKKANSAKTNFLSRMTHDIRTPLNGIIGLLKIEETHADDQELIRANRKKMLVSANHLLSLINDMLQMSKLEDKDMVLAHELVNLNELSRDILTIVEQRAAEAGVTLEYDKSPVQVKYPYVYGSPLHLRQLFLNIYGNCIKYNKVGGKVETHFECLGMEDNVVTYRWTIADTGIGMSQEFLAHIFEPFAQERSDARSVYQGTGLGMAIVKSLVDKMNGTIEITSEEGVGSTFVITIPFEITDGDEKQKEETATEKVSIEGLHLLLAEDNELNAEIAEVLFEDEGASIVIAKNGQEAIDQFKNHQPGTFDAILMDIMMPQVDGFSATRAIRSMERADAQEIPIIAMTANAFDEDAKQCFEAGMNAHLSKPLQMDIVVTTIAKYCRK